MPGLREWGSGLEALTECYLKYVQGYIVEAGRTFQKPKKITHPRARRPMTVRYPYDIDLIAVNPDQRKVVLVSCSQKWNKSLKKTEEEFARYENVIREPDWLGFGRNIIIERKIACVEIPDKKRQLFLNKGIEVLQAEFMLEKLLELIKSLKADKRTGAHLEPLIWILHTLYDMGKIKN